MSFTFVDLFAGLGGFHLAADSLGGHCVMASEIKPKLKELYLENFQIEPKGDIREIDTEEVPAHEVLFAGFPCQPFSKAGEQLGWRDSVRGTLFFDIARIVEYRRPKLILLENVANFVNHNNGDTYRRVQQTLSKLGYWVESRRYSPHHFGVPQTRERVYIVGVLDGKSPVSWPQPLTNAPELSVRSILDKKPKDAIPVSERDVECLESWQEFLDLIPPSSKLPSFPIWGMEFGATYPFNLDSLSQYELCDLQRSKGSFGKRLAGLSRVEIYENVPSHARGTRKVFPKWKQDFIRQNREFYLEHKENLRPWLKKLHRFPSSLQKLEWNCQGEVRRLSHHIIQFRASGVRVKRSNLSPSLVAMTATQVPIVGWERRYFTVRECARLQSMEGLRYLPKGNVAFEALGNAVNVKVVSTILKSILPGVSFDH